MNRFWAVACVSLLVVVSNRYVSAGQAAQDSTDPVLMNRAPVSDEVISVDLRSPAAEVLENGLRLLVIEDHRSPMVSMQLSVSGAGSLYDPPELAGLAAVTSALLMKGTRNRTGEEIGDELTRLGASVRSSSAAGDTSALIRASGLSRNMDQWFPVLADVLLNPVFDETQLRDLKLQGRLGLTRQQLSGAFLAEQRYYRALYEDHPGAVRSATDASLTALSVGALAQWHRERYTPENSILVVVGDVTVEGMVDLLNEHLVRWPAGATIEVVPPVVPVRPDTRRVLIVNRPGSAQTNLMIGNLTIDRSHPDYIPLRVMNEALGGSVRSRLFEALMKRNDYALGVVSSVSAVKYPGPWTVSVVARTVAVASAIDEVMVGIEQLGNEPISLGELNQIKRPLIARFALTLEEPDSLLSYFTMGETYQLRDDHWNTYPARVMAVTGQDVARVARQYLDPLKLQIVAAGDAGDLQSVLERYGPVEVYETDGSLR
jgi:zinc protease